MPLNDEQNSDCDSSRFSESTASSSDSEYSRQSFTSDSSSKPSSPASTSPPKMLTFDEMMAAARNLSNLTLAHEIAVNENFHLQRVEHPQNSLPGRVRQIVHQVFWDRLEEDLNKDPPMYEHAIKLFEEIKEILLSFLNPGANRMRSRISEVLDADLIRQQAQHEAVDIQGLANYVITTMGKLCAPVRDNDVNQLKATGNIVALLRQIFHVLDLMRMDMVNFTIQSLRPHLQRNLVDYEREKFQEILEETSSALDVTTEWIRESIKDEVSSVSGEASSSSGANGISKPNLSPTLVLTNSYLKLLQWDYEKKIIPETLVTDEGRLRELTEKLNQLKIVACISLITSNMVGAATEGIVGFCDKQKRISFVLLDGMNKKTFDLKEALTAIGLQTCSEINQSLTERGFPPLNKDVEANLVGQLCNIVEEDNPISSLIDKRIQLYMRSLLASPYSQKSMATIPGGLAVVQTEVESIGSQFANIANLNKQVYGPFYANILRKLLFNDEYSRH
ncbi:T-complex protein 11-like protein 2 [Heteronotia binoei]|uniref:T-complex protein 11-like protein 2 n=1 Tax=Heteronotia binoei TaxID=13085 RepID=UPI002931E4B7|nr:T-complex protein 11-like protein 2 [Heteronotia binoei]XP_060101558.1 T-complex protein 11-like protein 2 [Heteronotia binoei]